MVSYMRLGAVATRYHAYFTLMIKTRSIAAVDAYISSLNQWRDEVTLLRSIVLSCDVNEELKWRQPTYTVDGKNVVIISTRKNGCVIGFFKGVLLEDPRGILRAAGPNSQSARYATFTSVGDITKHRASIVALITQAIQNEKQGKRTVFKGIAERTVPIELQALLHTRKDVREAFEALTPGRKRGYYMHIAGAKLPATRVSRAEACVPRILAGKGLNDR